MSPVTSLSTVDIIDGEIPYESFRPTMPLEFNIESPAIIPVAGFIILHLILAPTACKLTCLPGDTLKLE